MIERAYAIGPSLHDWEYEEWSWRQYAMTIMEEAGDFRPATLLVDVVCSLREHGLRLRWSSAIRQLETVKIGVGFLKTKAPPCQEQEGASTKMQEK